ncbi:MAG: DnaJ domain-containing protein [Armatimonadetes bacterium]|nr:DnaJ domain-containing protein [Armatimonadota bacterium]MBS1710570.1 DnaJ domain-containing protein [Armatimonadota bacterium]MBX3108241.1 DnaJ domain-containing protein [Fimbriimonadaceae bacterium]
MATLYDVLGISHRSNAKQVREAYHKLAREFHPDVNTALDAHERMAEINVAFEVLSDPLRRSQYDSSIGFQATERETRQGDQGRPTAVRAEIFRRLRHHRTPVYGIAFEPGGRMVSSSFDNEVIWWDSKMEHRAHTHRFEGGVVNAIGVPADGRVVAAGSTEQLLSCWTLGPGGEATSWRQSPKSWVCCVAPSPDGKLLAYGTVNRSAHVARAADGFTEVSVFNHEESVTALAWRADSRVLATGSADATVRLWDPRSGREIHTVNRIISTVTAISFSPDGRWLAVAAVDLSIRIVKLSDMSLVKTFHGHSRPIEAMAFHPRSWLLATASRDGSVGLWDVKRGIGHGQIEASHQPISCLAFSPNGHFLAAGGLDKMLRVWKLGAA